MKTLIKLLLLLTAIGNSGYAQAQIPEKLSLQQAIEYAIEHSWAMKQANQDVEIAKAKVWETITQGLPEVSASSDISKNLDIAVTPIPAEIFGGESGTYINAQFSQKYNANWGINASQLIFDGSYIVGLMASKIYVNLSRNAAIKTELEISNATEQAYYNVLLAQKNINLLTANLEITETLLKETKAQNEAGFVEALDVDRLYLSAQRAKTDIQKGERQLKVAKVVLNYTLGLTDMNSSIQLTDNLESFIESTTTIGKDPSFSYTQHIDYILLKNQRKAQDLSMKNTVAANLPKISAFYNFGRNTFGNDDWNLYKSNQEWFKTSVVGLSLSMPIIGFGKMWSQAKQAKLERNKIDQQLEETQIRINRDLLMALTQMRSAKETYLNENKNLELAQKIYNTAQIKYKNGVGTSLEVTQAEQEYQKSQKAYIQSISELTTYKILLDKALSKL